MVVAAALLVLAGLGMFVVGLTTAVAAWSWACLGACVAAGVLLLVARWRTPPVPAGGARSGGATTAAPADRPGPPSGGHTTATTPEATAPEATAPEATAPEATAPEATAPEATAGTPSAPVTGDGSRAEARPSALRPGGTATASGGSPWPVGAGEPGEEDGEVTDLLLVVDLADEVLVVDEHPRYHLAGCSWLAGRETVPLPVREARGDGFTPCAVCAPDAHLATVERARRAARRS